MVTVPAEISKKDSSFFEKKEAKKLYPDILASEEKFFASFFQKRRFLLFYFSFFPATPSEEGAGNALVSACLNRLGLPDRTIAYITLRITFSTGETPGTDLCVAPDQGVP